jgi:hypothetical protein
MRLPDTTAVDACHCGMCRRWGGGPALGVNGGTEVRIDGAESVRVYRSSEWAERAFCGNCGTHLYYRLLPTGEYFVPVGLFQSGEPFAFKEQIFIDRKPDFYAFANRTHDLTEAEVFARYVPAGESESGP